MQASKKASKVPQLQRSTVDDGEDTASVSTESIDLSDSVNDAGSAYERLRGKKVTDMRAHSSDDCILLSHMDSRIRKRDKHSPEQPSSHPPARSPCLLPLLPDLTITRTFPKVTSIRPVHCLADCVCTPEWKSHYSQLRIASSTTPENQESRQHHVENLPMFGTLSSDADVPCVPFAASFRNSCRLSGPCSQLLWKQAFPCSLPCAGPGFHLR